MSRLLYTLFIYLQTGLFHLASWFNPKAAKWVNGRRQWRTRLKGELMPGKPRIWVHAASLGEFEQGRPLIEKLKTTYRHHEILLTFFSPSGYEVQKNYKGAAHIHYLPADTPQNARDFIDLVQPAAVCFIKYEFWFHYLHQLHQRQIPVFLVSAAFMPDHVFFKWYGGLFRKMLDYYSILFLQDESNKALLSSIGLRTAVQVTGDTRYDRVADIAGHTAANEITSHFKGESRILIAGSTWPKDEELLKTVMGQLPPTWKLILAPHDISDSHLQEIAALFGTESVFYSRYHSVPQAAAKRVLVVDNIGLLSQLYTYGEMAYIGGGFMKRGLHNILEPAVFGLPVFFGPEYGNFVEAIQFVEKGFAFPVGSPEDLLQTFRQLDQDRQKYDEVVTRIRTFMQSNIGATERVVTAIRESGLLA